MTGRNRKDELQYVQSMLRELRDMALSEEVLSYLIEMAYLEASDRIREIHSEGLAKEEATRRAA